ncbi:MAG: TVP38/TMEM64 family protein [Planctomycetales bacterium]|nr:TVP38/TMEM64 family protein [Planctomycetales bacterium]
MPARSRNSLALLKPIIFVGTVVALFFIYREFGDQLTLTRLAGHEQALRSYEAANLWIVLGGAFLLYVVVSGTSIPGAAVALTLVYGSYFGFLRAVVIVSFASTMGATIAFLFSRYLFQNVIQTRFADRLKTINEKLDSEGAFYLFSLRLIPAVPFFLINLLMGLTKMPATKYWWVSQIGMLPGTMAYVYAGSTLKLSKLATDGFDGLGIEVLIAFVVLGLMPFVIKRLVTV